MSKARVRKEEEEEETEDGAVDSVGMDDGSSGIIGEHAREHGPVQSQQEGLFCMISSLESIMHVWGQFKKRKKKRGGNSSGIGGRR
jgi:hypothetical protein